MTLEDGDMRNHLTLVQEDHIDFISRLTARQTAQFARLSIVSEIMDDLYVDHFMARFMRIVVSRDGKGREELVEAMKGDHLLAEMFMDRDTVPRMEPRGHRQKTRDRMRGQGGL